MPNHESNHVVVVGEPAAIKLFLEEAFSEKDQDGKLLRVLDFDLIVPSPPNKEQGSCSGQHDEGVVCWYAWNVTNWGTKWGAYSHRELEVAGDEGTVQVRLYFETAWTAPTPIFQAIEQRWGVEVNAITLDEGGYPPTLYGDNVHDYLSIETSVEYQ